MDISSEISKADLLEFTSTHKNPTQMLNFVCLRDDVQ